MNRYYGIEGSNELLVTENADAPYIEMIGDRPDYYFVATSGGDWVEDLALKAIIDAG